MLAQNHPGDIAIASPTVRTRWETHNPRALLWQLKEDNPKATNDDLLAMFRERVIADEEYLTVVIDYFFVNASRAWREARGENKTSPEKVQQKKENEVAAEKATALVKKRIVANAKTLVLMDFLLPHGKTLAASTGKECRMLGPKVGNWLFKIGEAVPTAKLVGKTLTEKKVRSIWARS